MCIHYTIEFWTPNPNPNADVERRALRGILAPGQNRAARQREFWLHDRDYLSSPRCRGEDIREGGVYYGRVFEFCLDDVDCRSRRSSEQSTSTMRVKCGVLSRGASLKLGRIGWRSSGCGRTMIG